MVWDRLITTVSFTAIVIVCVSSIIMFTGYSAQRVLQVKKNKKQAAATVAVVWIIVILNGIGCIIFKLLRLDRQKAMIIVHAVLHFIPFLSMIIVSTVSDRKDSDSKGFLYWRKYGFQIIFIVVYSFQYFLSPFLLLIRDETGERARFFKGMHVWTGYLVYMYSVYVGHLEWGRFCWENWDEEMFENHWPAHFLMLFYLPIFYVILNPYYHWKRLRTMCAQSSEPENPTDTGEQQAKGAEVRK